MGKYDECPSGSEHNNHIGALEPRGESETVERITGKPAASCTMCGAEAHAADYLCSAAEKAGMPDPGRSRPGELDEGGEAMAPEFLCHCPAEHASHFCQLKNAGKFQEMKALSIHPVVSCLLCDELSDSSDHVCSPVEL